MDSLKALFTKFRRLITFGFVGVINTLVDFAVFTLLSLIPLSEGLCQAGGYCAGIVCSFILNRSFTFKDGSVSLPLQIIRFIVVNAVSLAVSVFLIKWLVSAGVNLYLAKVPVTAAVMLLNYFGYKLLVFGVKDTPQDPR